MKEMVRLDKYLADMSIGTRSEVKDLIRKGKVNVNGEIKKKPETKIQVGEDHVFVNGMEVSYVNYEYYLLNKPAGVISASNDKNAKTVIDLIKESVRKDLFPVGRLDKDTEGLLLITNDGDLAHQLLSPKKHVDKVYFAKVLGKVTKQDVETFHTGIQLEEDFTTMPADLVIKQITTTPYEKIKEKIYGEEEFLSQKGLLSQNEHGEVVVSEIEITIREGKFHQVKRMFEAVDKKVVYLKRIAMGNLKLDETISLGEYRHLSDKELEELRQ